MLRRTADDTDPYEQVVVANASHQVVVTALADPEPRTGFVDRCLVAAYAGGLAPMLCLTKADLADRGPFAAEYTELDLPVVVTRAGVEASAATGSEIDPTPLREIVDDRVSAMVGHSGVGKSTLVNALVPDAERAVGTVSGVGKGRPTSTSTVALPLPATAGGWTTRRACAPSGSPTSPRRAWWRRSATWPWRSRAARVGAPTWARRRSGVRARRGGAGCPALVRTAYRVAPHPHGVSPVMKRRGRLIIARASRSVLDSSDRVDPVI